MCEMRTDLLRVCVCVGVGRLRETETTRKGAQEEGAGATKEEGLDGPDFGNLYAELRG